MGAILQALLHDVPEELASERLVLKATRAGRGAETNAACAESQRELQAWMPWAREPQTVEQSEAHCRAMHAKWHSREELDFCFYRAADGLLVGKGGLHTIDWTVPKFEVGYWIRTSCTRQGFATEATLALVGLARRLGARRVEEFIAAARDEIARKAQVPAAAQT